MSTGGKAKVSSLMLLLLLLSHLFTSVCDGRPAESHRHSEGINPRRSDDDNDEPSVFAVFERDNLTSGGTREERQLVVSDGDVQQQQPGGPSVRRRRSTLGWLQTALRMCEMGFTAVDRRCRRIEVDDGHVHVTVVLRDE